MNDSEFDGLILESNGSCSFCENGMNPTSHVMSVKYADKILLYGFRSKNQMKIGIIDVF